MIHRLIRWLFPTQVGSLEIAIQEEDRFIKIETPLLVAVDTVSGTVTLPFESVEDAADAFRMAQMLTDRAMEYEGSEDAVA